MSLGLFTCMGQYLHIRATVLESAGDTCQVTDAVVKHSHRNQCRTSTPSLVADCLMSAMVVRFQ